mgnify:CR=1 FL=1
MKREIKKKRKYKKIILFGFIFLLGILLINFQEVKDNSFFDKLTGRVSSINYCASSGGSCQTVCNSGQYESSLSCQSIDDTKYEKEVSFEFYGNEITGRLPRHIDTELGKPISLSLDLSEISIFDKESNQRI